MERVAFTPTEKTPGRRADHSPFIQRSVAQETEPRSFGALTVNQPGDKYEREADHMADQVMRTPAPILQRKCANCQEDELGLQRKCEKCEEEEKKLQRSSTEAAPHTAPASVNAVLNSSGEPLDPSARAFLEPRFGHDFSKVRVHTDAQAAASAGAVNARAYTVGSHIVFNSGRYAPRTESGQRLLAHELSHVIQQGAAGSKPADALDSSDRRGSPALPHGATTPDIAPSVRVGLRPRHFHPPSWAAGPCETRPIGTSNVLTLQRYVEPWIRLFPPEAGKVGPEGARTLRGGPLPRGGGAPRSGTLPQDDITFPPVDPIPYVEPQADAKPRTKPRPEDVKRDLKCGSLDMPLTKVKFSPGPRGQGRRVVAKPLTMCPGNTEGSPPDNAIYKEQFDCINAAGQEGYWVRAHVLHGWTPSSGPFNLHGPGNDPRNLIISDKSLNQQMSSVVEKPAIDLVYNKKNPAVLWYDAQVTSYWPGLDFFAEHISVTYGHYNPRTAEPGPSIGGGSFQLKYEPPNCPATASQKMLLPPTGSSESMEPSTPVNDLLFQSYVKICKKGRKSRVFRVDDGGVEIAIDPEWVNADGDRTLDPSKCKLKTYTVELWENNRFIDSRHKIVNTGKVGEGTVHRWYLLRPGEYYFKVLLEDHDDGCCLRGDVVVSTFHSSIYDAYKA